MTTTALDYFELVLVINLESRPDRRREMQAQLRSIGYDFGGRIQLYPASRPDGPGGFRSVGAHGCFLSHLGCLTRALESNAKSILILEDDVDFAKDFPRLQQAVYSRLEQGDWGMFYGGGHVAPGSSSASLGAWNVPTDVSIGLAHFVGLRTPRIAECREYLTAMLRRPAGDPNGGPMDVDGAYSWFRREHQVPTLMASPELAHQRSSASNISPRWFDTLPVLGWAAERVRNARNRRP